MILPKTSLDEAVFLNRLPSREVIVLSIASSLVADVELTESRFDVDWAWVWSAEADLGREGFSDAEVRGCPTKTR